MIVSPVIESVMFCPSDCDNIRDAKLRSLGNVDIEWCRYLRVWI
jgi:hypothetical protein